MTVFFTSFHFVARLAATLCLLIWSRKIPYLETNAVQVLAGCKKSDAIFSKEKADACTHRLRPMMLIRLGTPSPLSSTKPAGSNCSSAEYEMIDLNGTGNAHNERSYQGSSRRDTAHCEWDFCDRTNYLAVAIENKPVGALESRGPLLPVPGSCKRQWKYHPVIE
jgi:hypothetical protein